MQAAERTAADMKRAYDYTQERLQNAEQQCQAVEEQKSKIAESLTELEFKFDEERGALEDERDRLQTEKSAVIDQLNAVQLEKQELTGRYQQLDETLQTLVGDMKLAIAKSQELSMTVEVLEKEKNDLIEALTVSSSYFSTVQKHDFM